MEELTKDEKEYIIDQLMVVLDSSVKGGNEITSDNWRDFDYKDYYQLERHEYELIKSIVTKLTYNGK